MVKTKILADEITDKPANGFDKLSTTLAEIIKNSKPHFTIGIYGEWGTGKTTLMRAIENNLISEELDLKKSKILPIWFNAWRYEREEQFATIAMMKTIAYGMADHVKFHLVAKAIKKGLFIMGKGAITQLALKIITEKSVKDFEDNFSKRQKFLSDMEKDTIYFDGLNAISKQMKEIRKGRGGNNYRIVVFVDDLDRCSPKKALEVLESIKVFLDIEGFVYVLGISHETINRLITHTYKDAGIKGSDYIKKIIQIPIKLPSWEKNDLIDLIENNLSSNLKREYAKLIIDNSHIITNVVDNNPRQLKRFINNLIIAYEIFADEKNEILLEGLFITQIIKKRLPEFYRLYTRNSTFQIMINYFLRLMKHARIRKGHPTEISFRLGAPKSQDIRQIIKKILLPKEKVKQENDDEHRNMMERAVTDIMERADRDIQKLKSRVNLPIDFVDVMMSVSNEDWLILRKYSGVLSGISNWTIYDNALDIVEDIPIKKFS